MGDKCKTLRDDLALTAPPAEETFVPDMVNPQPTVVLSPAAYIEANYNLLSSGQPDPVKTTFNGWYDQVGKTWDDQGYADNNDGATIPVYIKQIVSDQQALYDAYVVAEAQWQEEYELEKNFQWPYYWADQIIARRSA